MFNEDQHSLCSSTVYCRNLSVWISWSRWWKTSLSEINEQNHKNIGSTGSNLKCALNTQTLYQDETERAEGRQRIENRDTEKDRQKQAAGLLTTRTGRRSRKRQGRKRPYKAGVVFFCFFFLQWTTTTGSNRCGKTDSRQTAKVSTSVNTSATTCGNNQPQRSNPKKEWNSSLSQETTTELLTEKLQYARLHRPHNERSLLKSRIRFSSYIHRVHFK